MLHTPYRGMGMAWAKSCVSMQVFGGPVVPKASPRLTKMHNDKVKIMLGYHAGPIGTAWVPMDTARGRDFGRDAKGVQKWPPPLNTTIYS